VLLLKCDAVLALPLAYLVQTPTPSSIGYKVNNQYLCCYMAFLIKPKHNK